MAAELSTNPGTEQVQIDSPDPFEENNGLESTDSEVESGLRKARRLGGGKNAGKLESNASPKPCCC